MRTLSERALLVGCAVGAAFGALACGADSTARRVEVRARVQVQSTDGRPMAGARVWVDGREAGSSDDAGRVPITLSGPADGKGVVTTACPSSYRTLASRREVPLSGEPTTGGFRQHELELTFRCEPLERLAALVVRVRGPERDGLPLRVRERVVGQTDVRGTAHVALRVAPQSSLAVQLDTRAAPELEPESPIQTFALGADDSILLFEQTLTRR